MNNIAIFKAESETEKIDPYIEILRKKGHKATLIPTLAFSFINSEILQEHLSQPDIFEGIIFTSPRTVEAVNKSISGSSDNLLPKWRSKKNFCVGESTANLANPDGCCKSFLFPCSNKRRETVPTFLQENGFKIIEVVSYETICNPSLKSHWEKLVIEQGLPNILVFFSPSGVQYCHKLIKESYFGTSLPKIIAIGPSTEKALIEASLTPYKIAVKPTPNAVYEIIESLS
ncbi:uroporphyrinogen-III synthase isoform X2 [Parasteatoda tepidariorum]|uniref:uroporphyrinogen-III synthase isoform X2 n=1 Tax=Parasteatoda tepidariorum TaxID=114398 RepID=UPI001C71891B|nr:uroporphyrinogen-III synthase isoform X2 [Parasteatoda tepidariorum]